MRLNLWHAGAVSEMRFVLWRDHRRALNVWSVVVVSGEGRRCGYVGPLDAEDRQAAVAMADWINRYIADHPEWSPDLRPEHWTELDPVYGSDEYVRQGAEIENAWRERADDPWYYEDAVALSYAS